MDTSNTGCMFLTITSRSPGVTFCLSLKPIMLEVVRGRREVGCAAGADIIAAGKRRRADDERLVAAITLMLRSGRRFRALVVVDVAEGHGVFVAI